MNSPSGLADIHCHLVPGVDDGPRTSDESLDLCRQALEEGCQTMAAVVHQLGPFAANTRADILHAFGAFKANLAAEGVGLDVCPSAEWLIEPDWVERFAELWPDLLTIADANRYALIEFRHRTPHHLGQIAKLLATHGVRPVIAHVDRYLELFLDPVQVQYLIEDGFVIQLNSDAIDGRCGHETQRSARRLIQMGLVHVVASDGHRPKTRPILLKRAFELVARWSGAEAADLLFRTNPNQIISGGEPKLPPRVSWFRRLVS